MKGTRFLLLFIFVLATACVGLSPESSKNIILQANVYPSATMSRTAASASPYQGSIPSLDNRLNAEVWFSNTPGVFNNNPVAPTYLPAHTMMEFRGSDTYAEIVTDQETGTKTNLKYPTNGSEVYCVGFYPIGNWETSDNIIVSHKINGNEDLMFADIKSGNWDSRIPPQNYEHLLTWIKVNVCAMTNETAKHWGNIQEISISSKESVEIDLSQDAENRVSYGGGTQFIKSYDDETGIALTLTSADGGSVFCSPSRTYTVRIKTSNMAENEVKETDIILSDRNYEVLSSDDEAKGKLFILSLYFSPFNVIEASCTLNYWNDQNEDLYLKP